jgi:hypothetical protein
LRKAGSAKSRPRAEKNRAERAPPRAAQGRRIEPQPRPPTPLPPAPFSKQDPADSATPKGDSRTPGIGPMSRATLFDAASTGCTLDSPTAPRSSRAAPAAG